MTLEKNKRVQRVVTTDSIDPSKLLLFQPTLCYKIGIPRCMKRGKGQTKVPIRTEAYSIALLPAHELIQKTKVLWLSVRVSGEKCRRGKPSAASAISFSQHSCMWLFTWRLG